MDMMAAEEARVSVDVQSEERMPVDGALEAIGDPDNKFQKAIAVWRGTSSLSSVCADNVLMHWQALICLHFYQSSMLLRLKLLHTSETLWYNARTSHRRPRTSAS
jgi:hypothetical protein